MSISAESAITIEYGPLLYDLTNAKDFLDAKQLACVFQYMNLYHDAIQQSRVDQLKI